MADKPADKRVPDPESETDEYELLPHKDILELKEELRQLKAKPTEKNLQISMVELSTKVDRLIEIFDETQAQLKEEGGGLAGGEGIQSLNDTLNKLLEQNGEIARGILGLSDIINELKESIEKSKPSTSPPGVDYIEPLEGPPEPQAPPSLPPLGQPLGQQVGGPNRLPPLGPPGGPLPPPPRRR